MSLDRFLAHGAKFRGVDAMRRLRAPPHHAVVFIGAAKAVTKEPALPERRRHTLADRRIRDYRPRHEAAETNQAGVERLGPIGHHMRPHRRMNAISTNDEIALGKGAVGKMRDDGPVGAILDGDEPFLEPQLDILAPGLVDQRFVERSAAHVHRRLAETLPHVLVHRTEPGAGLRMEIEGLRDRSAPDHFVSQSDFGQHMHAVRCDLQAAADAGGMGPRLEHLDVDAGLLQEDRRHRTCDAAADDERFGSSAHVLLHACVG